MYSLETLYQQALSESDSLITEQRNGLSIIGHGVKLKKFGEDIQILNMGKGGDYYKECDHDEYQLFQEHGWVDGAKHLALSNCLYKLGLVEERIKREMNTRKNDKHIKYMKTRRDNLLKKYSSIKKGINEITEHI